MNEPEAGFYRPGMVAIHVCTSDDIHNPANWPGVISFPQGLGNGLAMRDGQVIDYELMEFTESEIQAMRFEFDDEADPAWGRFE